MSKVDIIVLKEKHYWLQGLVSFIVSLAILSISLFLFLSYSNFSFHYDIVIALVFGCLLGVLNDRIRLKDYYRFDITNKSFRNEYSMGYLKWGKWNSFKELKSLTIERTNHRDSDINLCFDNNEKKQLFSELHPRFALKKAIEISKSLDLPLFDASTDPFNHTWIEV